MYRALESLSHTPICFLLLPIYISSVFSAARMESNGQKNRIHISQATADILIDKGKRHWLTQREDVIEAKGKGKL